jgi:hypothetical protein
MPTEVVLIHKDQFEAIKVLVRDSLAWMEDIPESAAESEVTARLEQLANILYGGIYNA